MSKSRIEALSDGVFAIAMTLLVLKLEVPEVMHHSSNQEMLMELLALWPAFGTYVVTFLIAGGFWYLHHLTFHFISHVTGLMVWINLIFLMLVSLLPFSAGLMAHLFIHPVSQLFYFGNQMAIAIMLIVHWQSARLGRQVTLNVDQVSLRRITYRTWTVAISFGAAFCVAAIDFHFSAVALGIGLLSGSIVEYLRVRKLKSERKGD